MNKKTFLILTLIIFSCINTPIVYAYENVLMDSYTSGGQSLNIQEPHPSAGARNSAIMQSINMSQTAWITNITLSIKKVNTPQADLVVNLYAHNGTYGVNSTGQGASLGTSDILDHDTVGAAYALYTFNFTGTEKTQFTENTLLIFSVEATSGSINNTDYYQIEYDGTVPTHPGNMGYYDSGQWKVLVGGDVKFYVYVETLWDEVGDFINDAFETIGIYEYMTQITSYLIDLTDNFSSSLTRIVALMTQQFRVINEVYTFFTYWFTAIVGIVLDFSEYWQSVIDNTYAIGNGLGNIWDIVSYDAWAPVVPLALFLWYVTTFAERSERSGGEVQLFVNDINTAINLVSYFTGVFMFVANTVIDRVYGLFDAIT